ncbi:hypothetical protein EDC62_1544 [Tibeticola sediminis]|uniref:Uncharacterized protein n=1 Tax=Tibeticola sediminis TaxID=1917811 RepID=A0A3N4UAB2_9BURK|nr:hypothetical protein [Tibeticola sediminis]RPE67663.1 hypothetical protein EDC62_1544 [Tibeticola sediminis]
MNRWMIALVASFSVATSGALALGLVLFPMQSSAQEAVRSFPERALRGTLVVQTAPEVLLDGAPARLSPGARIHDVNNLLVLPAPLAGRELTVNYLRDPQGLVHEVWILNAAEAAQKRAGASSGRNFLFASEADTAPRDDGNTPYHQLPGFPAR